MQTELRLRVVAPALLARSLIRFVSPIPKYRHSRHSSFALPFILFRAPDHPPLFAFFLSQAPANSATLHSQVGTIWYVPASTLRGRKPPLFFPKERTYTQADSHAQTFSYTRRGWTCTTRARPGAHSSALNHQRSYGQ